MAKKRGRPARPAAAQLTQALSARRLLEKELATRPAATTDQAIASVARQLKISARTVKRRLALLNKDAGLKAELDEWFSHATIDAGEY